MADRIGQVSTVAARGARPRRHAGAVSALATLVLALALGAHPALAENGENSARPLSTAGSRQPLDLVSGSVARVTAIVESGPAGAAEMGQRQAALRQMAEELFDFDEMARLVLGQHWKDRSPRERAEFVRLFIDVLERAYMVNIGSYRLATITFQGEVINGSQAQVRSRIVTDKGSVIPVEYRLAHTGVRWAVYDVEADGISLIANYRSQLNSILRTSTFAELLERLRGRQASAAPRQGP